MADRTCFDCGCVFDYPSKLKRHLLSSDHLLYVKNLKELKNEQSDVLDEANKNYSEGYHEADCHTDNLYEDPEHSDRDVRYEAEYESMMNIPTAVVEDEESDEDFNVHSDDDGMFMSDICVQCTSDDFFPFSSDIEAIMFMLLHSPRPIGEVNLKFIWHSFHRIKNDLSTFHHIKQLTLPGYEPPKKYFAPSGIPFYMNSVTSIIEKCLSNISISANIARLPQKGFSTFSQLYQAKRWVEDEKYQAPMVLIDGKQYFTQDFVLFSYDQFGQTAGRLEHFFQNVSIITL
jgi:hypothetical protein